MHVIEKLRLQKFEEVAIPKNKDLFQKIGPRIPTMNLYGGENAPSEPMDKLAQIHAAENSILDEMEKSENANKEGKK